jgi:5-formyltetrahydrofolate cyclo-ligase
LVIGRNLVPRPATGITALRIFFAAVIVRLYGIDWAQPHARPAPAQIFETVECGISLNIA